MRKAPAVQWFFGDWQRDTSLRSCSLAARGLWKEMLCIMFDGTPRGYLKAGSQRLDDPRILSRMVGAESVEEARTLLAELESAAVFSREPDGTIYSRRMVRDAHISEVRSAAGQVGGAVAQAKIRATGGQTPAVAEAVAEKDSEIQIPAELDTPAFRVAWSDWHAYRRERNLSKWQASTVKAKLAKCAKFGADVSVEAIRAAIENGYQGFFPEKVKPAAATLTKPAAMQNPEQPRLPLHVRQAVRVLVDMKQTHALPDDAVQRVYDAKSEAEVTAIVAEMQANARRIA